MADYTIEHGNGQHYINGADYIRAKSDSSAKRMAWARRLDGFDINLYADADGLPERPVGRRRYLGGGAWSAWEQI